MEMRKLKNYPYVVFERLIRKHGYQGTVSIVAMQDVKIEPTFLTLLEKESRVSNYFNQPHVMVNSTKPVEGSTSAVQRKFFKQTFSGEYDTRAFLAISFMFCRH